MKRSFLLSFLPFFLLACGQSGELGETEKQKKASSLHSALQSVDETTIVCESGDCPAFVVGLFGLWVDTDGKWRSNRCSGVLVGANQILTNRHCIPEQVLKQPELCKAQVKIQLPAVGTWKKEKHFCHKIVFYSKNEPLPESPDYALIQIERATKRSAAPMSFSGLGEFEPVTLFKVDFASEKLGRDTSGLSQVECLANTTHPFSNKSLGALSSQFVVTNCTKKMLPGNSGSGVFNQNGELVGLFAYSPLVAGSFVETPLQKINKGGGSSLACLPFKTNPNRTSKFCEFKKYEHKKLAKAYALIRKIKNQEFKWAGAFLAQSTGMNRNLVVGEWSGPGRWSLPENFSDQTMGASRVWVIKQAIYAQGLKLPSCINLDDTETQNLNIEGVKVEVRKKAGQETLYGKRWQFSATLKSNSRDQVEIQFHENPLEYLVGRKVLSKNQEQVFRILVPTCS